MIEILYDCPQFTVAVKPAGVLSEEGENTFPDLLAKQLLLPRLYTVHRLDRNVAGVMIYAKTSVAAALLSNENVLEKTYLAVVKGVGLPQTETLTDLLFKDSARNKTFVVTSLRKGVRTASLSYQLLQENKERCISLVKIRLFTGRSHQIRAQFSHRKHPVVGDGKYGGGDNAAKNIALFSHSLAFSLQGQEYCFFALPGEGYPWECFTHNEIKGEPPNKK